jgi:hypothetical protein
LVDEPEAQVARAAHGASRESRSHERI